MNKKYIWLAAAIGWCAAIFIATASPSSTGGRSLLFIQSVFHLNGNEAAFVNLLFRKTVHLTAFGLLAVLFYNSFERKKFYTAWLITTLYAATDEIHQAFIPERTGAIIDVGLDSLGAFLALVIVRKFIGGRTN